MIGHYLSNPFYLIKTHLQSESAKAIAVGHQHHHAGTWKALTNIYNETGVSITVLFQSVNHQVLIFPTDQPIDLFCVLGS